ncbi:MAG: hypothetical protein HY236_05755 [Acidobacteria bacterium]|nr:hypothetical protein [Acidobacteriota bacterium]
MATALGIDLSDPDDRYAQIVRIGIADLDPSRVLKNCQHLFVTLGSRGLLAAWLRLPTAGQKVIHCTLHRYAGMGWTLDGIYRSFKRDYCDKCPDCSPHSPEWAYSEEWQQVENERHRGYMESLPEP